jgi:maleylpyruvate isomerase
VAHLARNAESQVHLFHGPRQGAVHHQYPSRESREADIARTSELSFEQLCAEMSHSMRALEEAWNELGTHDWDALAQTFQGPVTLRECVFRRLREVEVHHVDPDVSRACHAARMCHSPPA